MPRYLIIHVTLGLIRIMIKIISFSTISNNIIRGCLHYNHVYFQNTFFRLSIIKVTVQYASTRKQTN